MSRSPGRSKILFGFAPTQDQHDRFFNCYPSSLLHAIAPLIAHVDAGRLDVAYCDRIFHPKVCSEMAWQLWNEMLLRERPSHVAISSTYDSWHVALQMSRVARTLLPDLIVIHGGPHLDEVLEPFVLARTPQLDPLTPEADRWVDFLVGGDGEHALAWLVQTTQHADSPDSARAAVSRSLSEVADLPGKGVVTFRADGERLTARFRNPLSLDDLPFVPRHLLPVADRYDFDCFRNQAGVRRPTVTMISHRGCRARCNFCSEGLPYVARSHQHILREAEQLRDAGVEALFLDDSTVQDDPGFEALLGGFHVLGLEVGALTRFDQIQDQATLHRMRDKGLVYFYASVEQYSDASLDQMHKKLRTAQIDIGVQNCVEAGIRLGVSLLFGLPYETPGSVDATLDYAAALRNSDYVDYISMSLYSYHPKTPLAQMQRSVLESFDFSGSPPHLDLPFTGFEEGSWFHPEHVTADYAGRVLETAKGRFGDRLVRELAKHRGDTPRVDAPIW